MTTNHTVDFTADVRRVNALAKAANELKDIRDAVGGSTGTYKCVMPFELISTQTGEIIDDAIINTAINVLEVIHDHIVNEAQFIVEYKRG